MSEQLPTEQAWHMRKADGYADLKMWDAARRELDAVGEAFRSVRSYTELRLRVAMGSKVWSAAVEIATVLRDTHPEEAGYWIQLAYATRRATSIAAAREVLREARQQFPEEPIIPYNLACYECQMGDTEGALTYLKEAEKIEPGCHYLAKEDDDLKPLWDELEEP